MGELRPRVFSAAGGERAAGDGAPLHRSQAAGPGQGAQQIPRPNTQEAQAGVLCCVV